MLAKLNSIAKVESWLRSLNPDCPFITIYHGFQTVKKSPSDVCYRNTTTTDLESSIEAAKNHLKQHQDSGGQFTVLARANAGSDTTGFTQYVELLPNGYGYNYPVPYGSGGVHGLTPQYSNEDIESKIGSAIGKARLEWEKDMAIAGLKAEIEELKNAEPEGYDWAGTLTGLAEIIAHKIPAESIGKIFESFAARATPETLDKVANVGTMYYQAQAAKAAAQQPNPQDEEEGEYDV
jgi:hypothetical protein